MAKAIFSNKLLNFPLKQHVFEAISTTANTIKLRYGNNLNMKAVLTDDHAHFCYYNTEAAVYAHAPPKMGLGDKRVLLRQFQAIILQE